MPRYKLLTIALPGQMPKEVGEFSPSEPVVVGDTITLGTSVYQTLGRSHVTDEGGEPYVILTVATAENMARLQMAVESRMIASMSPAAVVDINGRPLRR